MNRKGFTLIELLATIALLAIIAIISYVSINKVIEKNKEQNCHTLAGNIRTAANEYVSDNRYNREFINDYVIEVDQKKEVNFYADVLFEKGYLTGKLSHPFSGSEIEPSTIKLRVLLNSKDYTVNTVIIDSPEFLNTCVATSENNAQSGVSSTTTPTPTAAVPTSTTDNEKAYLKPLHGDSLEFKEEKEKIVSVYLVKNQNIPANSVKQYDLDEGEKGLIKGWLVPNSSNSSMYDLYIGAENKTIYARDLSSYFAHMASLQSISFNNLDTSETKDMSLMFYGCSVLTNLDLSNFNTSNVTNMDGMFLNMRVLKNLNISNFNTSNVVNMSRMFSGCYALTNLNLSGFITSKVTDMSAMFNSCSSIESLNLSSFDTSKVTDMSDMFRGMSNLKSVDISSFKTENVTNMSHMFYLCTKLTELNLSGFKTSKVTNMSGMFASCDSLKTLDLSNFNTSNVTNMGGDFQTISADRISGFGSGMFQGCSNLETIKFGTDFKTSKVTNMSGMFQGCKKLTSLDLSTFDTSNVTNMDAMFDHIKEIDTLNICTFDTSKVTTMKRIFSNTRFTKIKVGNGWVDDNNISSDNMFYWAKVNSVTKGQC